MKTIIWSVSSSAVYRNLFFFPGSLFERACERLRQHPDERIIFILPSQFRAKYGHLLVPEGLERQVIVAIADAPLKKSFFQRAFYFLYSYMVFTGTTRIMATMGTRPDEPPAGGKWYLAPAKILIARTLGTSRRIKRALVPYLWLKIFPERPFRAIFDEVKPDLVFAPHIYGWFDAHVLAEAKRRGIATVAMPAGWDHLDKYFLPFHADHLLVASDQVRRMALEHQAYRKENIALVGYPHFDFIVRKDYMRPRADVLHELAFPPDSKYILYVSGSAYCPDEPDIIAGILEWADQGKFGRDVRLVIRPYLGGRGRDKAFDMEKFNRFADHPRVVFYKQEFWGDLSRSFDFMNILAHADAVLALYTTMTVEAAVLDRPLIAPAFDGHKTRPYRRSIRRFLGFDHFREVLETGALRVVYNFDDLFSAIDAYLKNPDLDADKRQELRDKICGALDGEASARILSFLFKKP